MNHPADERLAELALGALAPGERDPLEAHLAGCAACRAALATVRAGFAGLALGLGPRAPGAEVRERLRRRVRGEARWLPFADRLAGLLDLPGGEAEALLAKVDDAAAWSPDALVAGAEVMLVAAGPAFEGAIASLVRLPPGARYPRHRHLGVERLFFLQGGVEHDDGSVADAGTLVESRPGSVHGFRVLPGPPCIAAVLVLGGIELEEGAGEGG